MMEVILAHTLEAIHIECEVSSYGPTILCVIVEVSPDPRCLHNVWILFLLHRGGHHKRQAHVRPKLCAHMCYQAKKCIMLGLGIFLSYLKHKNSGVLELY
jgi:hypothetical protein